MTIDQLVKDILTANAVFNHEKRSKKIWIGKKKGLSLQPANEKSGRSNKELVLTREGKNSRRVPTKC